MSLSAKNLTHQVGTARCAATHTLVQCRCPLQKCRVNLFDFLIDAARHSPDREALVEGMRCITYKDALQAAHKLGAALQARGIRPGDRVACLLPNTIEHYLAYFAIAGSGAILVSLNTRLAAQELRDIVWDAGATLLLHDDSTAALAAEIDAAFSHGKHTVPALLAHVTANAFCRAQEDCCDDVAHIYYTSGTTGKPKGVMLSHQNICTHAKAAVQELSLCKTDRWAHLAPMFHLADAWATFAITAVAGTHVFLPRFTPTSALQVLALERITITNLVPTMLNLMVKEPSAAQHSYSVRAMLSGGASIAPTVVQQILTTFCCDYIQTYGMTETSPYLTLSLLGEDERRLPPDEQLRLKCRTGRPFLGVELKVVDDTGCKVACDDLAVGEIRVRGKTVTKGYWRNPEATAAAFDDEGFLCTGDLATIDARGYVNIVDRKKDVIKTGGETVYSTEVENVLYRHPAILECAVFGVPDPVWGEQVAAAVVLREAQRATAEELIEFCCLAIARFKAPRCVRFLLELPKTGSGKIQKRALRERW